jgi:hypothetical protein
MENELLLALMSKMISDKLEDIVQLPGPRGQRGRQGDRGPEGIGFVFSEHADTIRQWAKEFSLKFEDLSEEQFESLRGFSGKDGLPGTGFSFEDSKTDITKAIKDLLHGMSNELKFKFSDLSTDEVESLRGPRGRQGADGKSFILEENRKYLQEIIKSVVDGMSDGLKLRFSDLAESELEQLRGPPGRSGRDGKSFDFEEHRDYFNSLKLKFSDLTEDEKQSLKLKFSSLTDEEKSSLKLKFSELSDEEVSTLKGPRGPRGQRGSPGVDGLNGQNGARGLPGPRGISGVIGPSGISGRDGTDGKDAPYIVAIDIEQTKNEIVFVFEFSDGHVIKSDPVDLPSSLNYFIGGGGLRSFPTIYDEGVELPQRPEIDFVGSGVTVTDDGNKTIVTITGGGGGSSPTTTLGDIIAHDGVSDVRIPGNPTNSQLFLSSTGSGGVAQLPSWQPVPVLGVLGYFFTKTASDVATYYKQLAENFLGTQNISNAAVVDDQLLSTFITDPGIPNRAFIPSGEYSSHIHAAKTSGTKNVQIYSEIWETNSSGADIVKIATLGPSVDITGVSSEYLMSTQLSEPHVFASLGSRLATKVFANVTGGGSAPTIVLYMSPSEDSRTNVPAPIVDATNFVPYTGAVVDIDLGTKDLTTTGEITAPIFNGALVGESSTVETILNRVVYFSAAKYTDLQDAVDYCETLAESDVTDLTGVILKLPPGDFGAGGLNYSAIIKKHVFIEGSGSDVTVVNTITYRPTSAILGPVIGRLSEINVQLLRAYGETAVSSGVFYPDMLTNLQLCGMSYSDITVDRVNRVFHDKCYLDGSTSLFTYCGPVTYSHCKVSNLELHGSDIAANPPTDNNPAVYMYSCFSNGLVDMYKDSGTTTIFLGLYNSYVEYLQLNGDCDVAIRGGSSLNKDNLVLIGLNNNFVEHESWGVYNPTTPGDWAVPPVFIRDALDELAGRAPGSASGTGFNDDATENTLVGADVQEVFDRLFEEAESQKPTFAGDGTITSVECYMSPTQITANRTAKVDLTYNASLEPLTEELKIYSLADGTTVLKTVTRTYTWSANVMTKMETVTT